MFLPLHKSRLQNTYMTHDTCFGHSLPSYNFEPNRLITSLFTNSLYYVCAQLV